MAEESAADLCEVGDAQSLALCCTSHDGYPVDGLLPIAHRYPHHALARSLCNRRHRSPLPGTLQVVPDSIRRPFTDRVRYVERNPLRANLVKQAEEWEYGSAWARQQKQATPEWLATVKNPRLPRQWRALVNKPQSDAELSAIRKCIVRGTPFGNEKWTSNTAVKLSLESTTRPRGRPRLVNDS